MADLLAQATVIELRFDKVFETYHVSRVFRPFES